MHVLVRKARHRKRSYIIPRLLKCYIIPVHMQACSWFWKIYKFISQQWNILSKPHHILFLLRSKMFSRRFETFFFSLDYTVILEACTLWGPETNLVSTSVMTTNETGLAFTWVELCRGTLLKHRITIPRSVQPIGHSL